MSVHFFISRPTLKIVGTLFVEFFLMLRQTYYTVWTCGSEVIILPFVYPYVFHSHFSKKIKFRRCDNGCNKVLRKNFNYLNWLIIKLFCVNKFTKPSAKSKFINENVRCVQQHFVYRNGLKKNSPWLLLVTNHIKLYSLSMDNATTK